MKKIAILFVYMFMVTTLQAQDHTETIKEIQNYIQETSQNQWFDPINKNGNLENGTSYDLSYYVLPTNEVFSIIYTVFEKHTTQKVFYYKNNQLIACITEETDANNANKLLRYADYFYKDGLLLNSLEEKKDMPAADFYNEGMQKLKTHQNN